MKTIKAPKRDFYSVILDGPDTAIEIVTLYEDEELLPNEHSSKEEALKIANDYLDEKLRGLLMAKEKLRNL